MSSNAVIKITYVSIYHIIVNTLLNTEYWNAEKGETAVDEERIRL